MVRKIALLLVVMLSFCCVFSFAAPASILPDNAVSTSSDLLTVTNPTSEAISSYDKTHNISGYAASGVELSIYYLNNGTYYPLYKDGAPIVFSVGASGMFIKPVSLSNGKNDLLVRAELNGKVQYTKKTINVLSFNLFNLFKGFNLF